MAKFKFQLLTGRDPQGQYEEISTKDPMTFYLLRNGIGYLGNICLFNATLDSAGSKPVITQIVQEEATNDTIATSKAIADYVAQQIQNINFADAMTAKFFRNVETCILTTEMMNSSSLYSIPSGSNVGDVGLLFTADTDDGTDEANEHYYFVSLVEYLDTMIEFIDTPTIAWTNTKSGGNSKMKANLIYDDTYMKIVNEIGLSLKTTNDINANGSYQDKLATDRAVIDYIDTVIRPRLEVLEAANTEHTTVINNITNNIIPRVETLEANVTTNTETLANEVVKFAEN